MTAKRASAKETNRTDSFRTLEQWKAAYLPSVVDSARRKKLEADPEALAKELAKQTVGKFSIK